MPNGVAPTPGMRVLCRDAEWLVTRVNPSDNTHNHYAVHCIGADDLVRGHEAIFLTQLDDIEQSQLIRRFRVRVQSIRLRTGVPSVCR